MNKVKIFITGDFCSQNRIADLIREDDYINIFNDLLPYVKKSDIAITNLECPITNVKEKIKKTGPHLKASAKTVDALNYAGFNLVSLANNHQMRGSLTGPLRALRCDGPKGGEAGVGPLPSG